MLLQKERRLQWIKGIETEHSRGFHIEGSLNHKLHLRRGTWSEGLGTSASDQHWKEGPKRRSCEGGHSGSAIHLDQIMDARTDVSSLCVCRVAGERRGVAAERRRDAFERSRALSADGEREEGRRMHGGWKGVFKR